MIDVTLVLQKLRDGAPSITRTTSVSIASVDAHHLRIPLHQMSAAANTSASDASGNEDVVDEDGLRRSLRAAMQYVQSNEPLEATYKPLLLNSAITQRRPVLVKDKLYKRLGSQLRPRVEAFLQQTQGKDPFDRIAQRQPLGNEEMRAAFTLRDAKEHEQQTLLEVTLASMPRRNGMDQETRMKYFDAVAKGLQNKKPPSTFRAAPAIASTISAAEQTEQAIKKAELERERDLARRREEARREREEAERRVRDGEQQKRRRVETPKQALHQLYYPLFKALWDTEFPQLGGINPFRIVIDRENCAAVGAPDYFSVITTPMNLTYIQQKVDNMEYDVLAEFFADIDLMIKNCLLYNSDPKNPYHQAALELKKKYMRLGKSLVKKVKGRK
ncbi:hypothetical protein MPSEU_000229100 [Mayamaea pseudoterrestris]|nr:hypothetical protein MPSEU_000229100 [Mayamaea pseudoterrestris]